MKKLFARLLGSLAVFVSFVAHGVEVVVFDSFTDAQTLTTTTGSPRTFMGYAFNAIDPGTGPSSVAITKMTVYLAYTGASATTYNTLRFRVQLWDTWASAASPVFSNAPASGVIIADVAGPITLSPSTFAPIDITLATPVTLTGLTNHGFAVNIQGDSGSGLVSSDSLTSLARAGSTPIAVGSSPIASTSYGYRNVAGQETFNFAPSDLRGFAGAANQGLAIKLFAQVPLSVTVNQAAGQADPTNVSPVNFTVAFNAPVTGFAADDVSFATSTAPGTLQATVTGGPSVYNVAVTGMTGSGTVVATVGANAALSSGNEPNTASTSTDNVVTYSACNLDLDRNGSVDATTDGLLVARFMRGIFGSSMVASALAANATITNPTVIGDAISRMASNLSLDLDGDGIVTADTDGVLLLRALAGNTDLSGIPTLGTPTRTTWPAIRSYLNTSCLLNLP